MSILSPSSLYSSRRAWKSWISAALLAPFLSSVNSTPTCSPSAIATPDLPGAEIQSLEANVVKDFSIHSFQNGGGPAVPTDQSDLSFCNVTITYSHTGHDTIIHATVWLPLTHDEWNGRFQGVGGGGWLIGIGSETLAAALADGYAAASTDGGLHTSPDPNTHPTHPKLWAHSKPNEVDQYRLANFATITLHDIAVLGRAVTTSFYGTPPHHSYWTGCSSGGRQGLVFAQRYPDDFDGILSYAPAMNWDKLPFTAFWSQNTMARLNAAPRPCELEYIRVQSIAACDAIDGVEDGIISLPERCTFDAETLVGQEFTCVDDGDEGSTRTISRDAALIANAFWKGQHARFAPEMRVSGRRLFHGFHHGTPFNGLAGTSCAPGVSENGKECVPKPFPIGPDWLKYFVFRDEDIDLTSALAEPTAYEAAYNLSVKTYHDVLGTDDPDLAKFRARGGRLLSVHGLADDLIPAQGTSSYYLSVKEKDADVDHFYRHFEAPGDGHCVFGAGPHPVDALERLVAWVEKDEAPETLKAQTKAGDVVRNLCQYPRVQKYLGGEISRPESFECVLPEESNHTYMQEAAPHQIPMMEEQEYGSMGSAPSSS